MTTFLSAFESTLADISGKQHAPSLGGLSPEDIVSKCRADSATADTDELVMNAIRSSGRAVRNNEGAGDKKAKEAELYEGAAVHVGALTGRYFDCGRMAESARCAAYVVHARSKARGEKSTRSVIDEMRRPNVS